MECLLCRSSDCVSFKVEKKPERNYFFCRNCDGIFMQPQERLSPLEEKARYDLHQNEGTSGYETFFAPLVKDIVDYFQNAKVDLTTLSLLDYGSGPTEMLSQIMAAKGFQAHNYDLYYNPNQEQLRKTYHVITSTEVWEHLHEPRRDIERILRLLKPGGLLGVMTSTHKGEAAFHDWHYRRDPTHVLFFSDKTLQWLAREYKLTILKARSPYFIFQKN